MLSGITISLLIAVFLGIVGWAYGRERQPDFTAASLLPLQQDSERKPQP